MIDQRPFFGSLYIDNHAMVRQMCLGFMKGDRDAANDLTQEVFISVWNALGTFKGESSAKTWIYRITVNTCLQFLRKKSNRLNVSLPSTFDIGEETTDPPDGNQALYVAIGSLPEVDRLIIMMVLDELDYDEIARVVGIENNNLRVRIHRIKKKLKELLQNEQRYQ